MKAETTTMLLPVTVFEAGADKDIEFESTLADYLPNINRIIRADADVMCEDVQIKGNKAEVSGKAVFTLLYESDFKQKLRHERFITDFIQRFDLRDLPDGELLPSAKVRCSYVGCKTLNPRRFILRCRADVSLTIKCMQSVQVVSMEDCKGAFFKSDKRGVAVYSPDILRDFSMEESVSFEAMPAVSEIIYTSLSFSSTEITQAEGSALIRSEASFKCLYEPEDEEASLQMLCRRFPAVFTIDDESITPESELCLSLTARSVEAEKDIDAYGENRVIQLRYGVRACLSCVNRTELEVPTDMFFEEYCGENKLSAIPYEEPVKDIKHRFTVDRIFEAPELSLTGCLDLNADVSVTEAMLTEDGISIKGSCDVNAFGTDGNGYRSQDFSIPFSELIPFSHTDKECVLKATALPQNAVAEISGGRLSVRIPTELSVAITYKEAMTVLSSAEIEKRTDTEEDGKPIIIYYPQKGENAWDIGKRYFVDPEAVKENNPSAFDKNGNVTEANTVLYM